MFAILAEFQKGILMEVGPLPRSMFSYVHATSVGARDRSLLSPTVALT